MNVFFLSNCTYRISVSGNTDVLAIEVVDSSRYLRWGFSNMGASTWLKGRHCNAGIKV